jgi:hypothetical protein
VNAKINSKAELLLGVVSMTRLALILSLGLIVIGCDSPVHEAISEGTEPYQIKTGEDLGIRLGMSLAEFKALRTHKGRTQTDKFWRGTLQDPDPCIDTPADDEVFCSIIPTDPRDEPRIGEMRISSLTLMFYQKRLIQVRYSLLGLDSDTLLQGLKDKFGNTGRHPQLGWRWRNSVSSISFEEDEKDLSAATLELTLTQEMEEWFKRNRDGKAESDKSL